MVETAVNIQAQAALLLFREALYMHSLETVKIIHGDRWERSYRPRILSEAEDRVLKRRILEDSQKSQTLISIAEGAIKSLNLNSRNESILKICFGWDGEHRILEEVGKEHDLARERIRQIRVKEVSRLRGMFREGKIAEMIALKNLLEGK